MPNRRIIGKLTANELRKYHEMKVSWLPASGRGNGDIATTWSPNTALSKYHSNRNGTKVTAVTFMFSMLARAWSFVIACCFFINLFRVWLSLAFLALSISFLQFRNSRIEFFT